VQAINCANKNDNHSCEILILAGFVLQPRKRFALYRAASKASSFSPPQPLPTSSGGHDYCDAFGIVERPGKANKCRISNDILYGLT